MDSVTLFPQEDEQLTLTELVDSYSSLFPLKVRVVKGFYGDRGEDQAIAVDELYHFHFVKRSKVRVQKLCLAHIAPGDLDIISL